MDIEEILLRREELPIGGSVEFSCPACNVPIHPSLSDMPNHLRTDQKLAYSVMNEAVDWYKEDMKRYADLTGKDRSILKKMPSKRGVWFDGSKLGSYDVGIDHTDSMVLSLRLDSDTLIQTNEKMLNMSMTSYGVKFGWEKFREYSLNGKVAEIRGHFYCDAFQWLQKKVYTIPQAIFLRDWAILYENELLKEMDKIGMLSVATV